MMYAGEMFHFLYGVIDSHTAYQSHVCRNPVYLPHLSLIFLWGHLSRKLGLVKTANHYRDKTPSWL